MLPGSVKLYFHLLIDVIVIELCEIVSETYWTGPMLCGSDLGCVTSPESTKELNTPIICSEHDCLFPSHSMRMPVISQILNFMLLLSFVSNPYLVLCSCEADLYWILDGILDRGWELTHCYVKFHLSQYFLCHTETSMLQYANWSILPALWAKYKGSTKNINESSNFPHAWLQALVIK